MKTLLSDAVKQWVRAHELVPHGAKDVLDAVVSDFGSKKHEVSQHRAKAQDAIDNGTKLTKRRIPL